MITQLRSEPNKILKPNRNDMIRMLVESYDSIDVDIPARYKALWVTNKLDGSEDHLVSERIITLVGQKLMLFRENLMKEPSPTNLKDMLKLITPPKDVKRAKGKNDVVPPDEGDELYDCDGDEYSYPINIDNQLEESDDENEQITENATSNEPATSTDNIAVREQNQQVAFIELAPLCSHPDLKKDAVFVDDLAKFIKTHDTLSKFLPHVTALKKQYLAARRQVKNRIKIAQNEVRAQSANENERTNNDISEDSETESNAFDLFD